ncbi:MAG: hypothetical protein LBI18_03320 [Planctomycetaceae bacterium]|jgi:hypothetical protein|nr:hypothetical protein [Planctomycetaceae bacterium]
MFRRNITHLFRNIIHLVVGNLSLKGCVGDSRLEAVFGRQFVLPSCLESDCQLNTGSELPYGNVMVGENPSAKHHPPF